MKKKRKIISGGQTGADRAALDAAIALGLDYGGAIPRGRLAEDGMLDPSYEKMTELQTKQYRVRTEKNVVDADSTLIFVLGKADRGTSLTIKLVQQYKKPFLIIDLLNTNEQEAINKIRQWLKETDPSVLNVAGSRESRSEGIYNSVFNVLKGALRKME